MPLKTFDFCLPALDFSGIVRFSFQLLIKRNDERKLVLEKNIVYFISLKFVHSSCSLNLKHALQ